MILVATGSPRASQASFRVERRASQLSSSWLFCACEKAESDPCDVNVLWSVLVVRIQKKKYVSWRGGKESLLVLESG